MKRTSVLFVVLLLIFSNCRTSSSYLKRGQFDSAVYKSVNKLRKKPTKTKEINVLREAYAKANQSDLDRISFLRTSGEPDVWDNIFSRYNALKNRQTQVKTLPTNILNAIHFVPVNYDEEVISAKRKAAEYFYAHALQLLERNNKQSARLAYNDLVKVKQYYSDYKDVDAKLQEALLNGRNNILFKIQNQANVIVPQHFEQELLKISMDELNTLWMNYHTRQISQLTYDYTILLNLKEIAVSPEQVREESYTDQKEIQDGFKYKLDAKGNVMKDSAGNDIKIPIIKIITCKVVLTKARKSAIIRGTLDYMNNHSGQLIKTYPVAAETFFENNVAVPYGDLNALSSSSRSLINQSHFVPFPSNPDIIMQAAIRLKDMTKDIIWRNKNIIDY
jgi:hypothetical protein